MLPLSPAGALHSCSVVRWLRFRYYPLEISYFKSCLDNHLLNLLWNKYWISTLASSPLLSNYEYPSKHALPRASPR